MQQCWDIVHHLHKWAHNICVLSEAADCAWKSAPVYMMMPRNVMLIMRLNQAMPKAYGQELNACITPCAEAMSFAYPSAPPHPAAPGARSAPPPSYMGAYWGRPKHTLAVFSANDCGSCTCYTNLSCDATWARPLTAGALVTPLLSSQPRLLHLGQIAADKFKMYLLISSIVWFWTFLLAV